MSGASKNIKPTFGISFGLPNQIGGGYPYPNPINTPNFADPGQGNGINLGLVSVNPLVALQVSKNDYGEKIFKPFVNLHFTPNNFLVHKVQNFLDFKKDLFHNSHQHYHHYKPHHIHKPPYHYGSPGPIFDKPPPYVEHLPSGHYHEEEHYHHKPQYHHSYDDNTFDFPGYDEGFYGRSLDNNTEGNLFKQYQSQYNSGLTSYGTSGFDQPQQGYLKDSYGNLVDNFGERSGKNLRLSSNPIKFPNKRRRRDVDKDYKETKIEKVRLKMLVSFKRINTLS